MDFHILRKTMLEVHTKRFIILVSYQTPVAYFDKVEEQWYRTTRRRSKTTSRHITEWAEKFHGQQPNWNYLTQDNFDEIFEEV